MSILLFREQNYILKWKYISYIIGWAEKQQFLKMNTKNCLFEKQTKDKKLLKSVLIWPPCIQVQFLRFRPIFFVYNSTVLFLTNKNCIYKKFAIFFWLIENRWINSKLWHRCKIPMLTDFNNFVEFRFFKATFL